MAGGPRRLVPVLQGVSLVRVGESSCVPLFQVVVGSDFYGSVEIISFLWSPSSEECRGSCVPGSLGLLGIRGETCFPFPRDLSFRKTASVKGLAMSLFSPCLAVPVAPLKVLLVFPEVGLLPKVMGMFRVW